MSEINIPTPPAQCPMCGHSSNQDEKNKRLKNESLESFYDPEKTNEWYWKNNASL